MGFENLVESEQFSSPVCSAKACRAAATWRLAWNNPRIHQPERRKTWLACDAHRTSLSDFLTARGFLRETTPLGAVTLNYASGMQPSVSPADPTVPAETPAPATWIGALARVELTVTDADTAQTVGSGDVPVLATPRVLALVEAASVAATTRRLAPGNTTVGTRVELDHLAATPVGRTVIAEARLTEAEGRRLRFAVTVRDAAAVVAEGFVERLVVDRHRFLAKATGTS